MTDKQRGPDDYAELLAAMSIAISIAKSKTGPNASIDDVLAQASKNMAGRHWQITAARRLKISPLMWFDRPWHCWQLRRIASKLLAPSQDEVATRAKLAKLTRYSALVEFGVDVNAAWYRRLREAVVDGKTTHSELRSLLRKPTIWWGTKKFNSTCVLGWLHKLWGIGRPSDGTLLIKQFHPVTRIVLWTILFSAVLGTGLGLGLVFRLASKSPNDPQKLFVLVDFTMAMIALAVASWWVGPASTQAVIRLQSILGIKKQTSQGQD
jgi:hypothetical protein